VLAKNEDVYNFSIYLSYLKRSLFPDVIAQIDSLYSQGWELLKARICFTTRVNSTQTFLHHSRWSKTHENGRIDRTHLRKDLRRYPPSFSKILQVDPDSPMYPIDPGWIVARQQPHHEPWILRLCPDRFWLTLFAQWRSRNTAILSVRHVPKSISASYRSDNSESTPWARRCIIYIHC